ncbi:LPP20 family lipoprotein [Thiomicrorhabdus immobilis]|nr:LPP20 family lipoprotein [Thiomicrorhabdus immobilis]
MKKTSFLIAGVASTLVLSGCLQTKNDEPQAVQVHHVPMVESQGAVSKSIATPAPVQKPELLKVTGIGYGAESTFAAYTSGQRRLMAIRSSKLDAYRALAEQLYGIKIDSNTSVSTLTAKNDSFRARVNAVVRGARVVSVTPMADNNYETVLEVYVDKKFFEEAFVYTASKAAAVEPEQAYKVSSY